ncbi:hypothetical protein [Thiohalobacter thiocyanaticus]|uniref:hypothetical protein n=1 Tax=Thiohalobacter thiocyanaticus TaxID=585455 RepID=UPI000F636162|nr:hypothetical protein [Thiohalobacter thiocyanaticus]
MINKLLKVLIIMFSSQAGAEGMPILLGGGIESIIGTKESFKINIVDEVEDGCLPRPSRLSDKAELVLRRNNFKINDDDSLATDVFVIYALGYETVEDLCVVYLSADLYTTVSAHVPFSDKIESGNKTLIRANHEVGAGLMAGPKSGMQKRLEEQANTFTETFVLNITRAKDHIEENYPSIFEERERMLKKWAEEFSGESEE